MSLMGVADFRLLGPIEVRIGDRLVDLGHARQRLVLVTLLLEVNTVVALDRVVERVWGEEAPQTATDLVYGYVSRLRRGLAGAVGLRHVPGGYRLDADPDLIDVHRFWRLVARARAAPDDEGAAALYADALGLWRGTAFTGVTSRWLEAMRLTLEQERLAAILDHVEVRLRLGSDVGVLSDLRELTARQPLDERAAGLFMRAAYQAGRRAEALERYHQLRRRLADELGVYPGGQLQQLFQDLLHDDPAPMQARGSSRPMARVLAQLPHDVAGFAGRAAEIAALDRLLAKDAGPATRVMVISAVEGVAGVGKTTLAIHWAHRVLGHFPDGQLFADLRGFDARRPAPPDEILGRFLRALGVSPQDVPTETEEQAALYRSLLAGRRVLVVLDNARTSEQVRPLLPGQAGCLVMVTSRNRLTGLATRDGARQLTLDVLDPVDARALLEQILGADRVTAEQEATADIACLCGYLPLALRIAAEHAMAHHRLTLTSLAAGLGHEQARLDILDQAENTAVRTAFSWSYQALPASAARMFRLLGLHAAAETSAHAAAALSGISPDQVARDLAVLARGHLLEETSPGRYRLHDLLRLYAAERAREEETRPDREAALRRVLDWYLHTADRAGHLLLPQRLRVPLDPPAAGCQPLTFPSYDAALHWCDAECANAVAATRQAAEAGLHDTAWKLPVALLDYFYLRKPWNEWTTAMDVGLAAARRGGDGFGEAALLTSLGVACYDFRKFPDAIGHLRQALTAWHAVGFPAGESVTLPALGAAYRDTGRLAEAVECLHRSQRISRQIGDRWSEAIAIHNLGDTYRQLGDIPAAISHLEQAVSIRRDIRDRYGEAWTLHDLGAAHRDLNHLTDAINCFEHALSIRAEIGDQHGQARTLRQLGAAYHHTGRTTAARNCWHQALAIFQQLGDPRADDIQAHLNQAEQDHPGPGSTSHNTSPDRAQ